MSEYEVSNAARAMYLFADIPQRLHDFLVVSRNQWKARAELEKEQFKRLKAMVSFAYNSIPYYHKRFRAANIKPCDLKTYDDMQKIPITTKQDIQKHYQDLLFSKAYPKGGKVQRTSGSTGMPLRVVLDRRTKIYVEALKQYVYKVYGLQLRDKLVIVVGEKILRSKLGPLNSLLFRHNLNCVPLNHSRRTAIEYSQALAEVLRALSPDALSSMPWVLHDLCKVDTSGITPRFTFSRQQVLTDDVRRVIEQVLETEVLDTYGSTEFEVLGFECPEHTGMHILTDAVYVEYLKNGEPVAPKESGEVVVTGLSNRAMPLIRYKLGDIAEVSDERCPCGRGWPLIKSILGRSNENLILPSGTILDPHRINHWLAETTKKNIWCFSQYQIVQEKPDHIVLRFVKGREFNPKAVEEIRHRAQQNCRCEDIAITTEIVDDIIQDRPGKRRIIIPYNHSRTQN
ncbi:MAG: phenylacetate--CoA ligase family protein [Candidatus Bathyarchaeota archaeon]|nr:MAG: phenylacetate--CoA ligase family protein [Candidatus Bathyarchaeota archaeon]